MKGVLFLVVGVGPLVGSREYLPSNDCGSGPMVYLDQREARRVVKVLNAKVREFNRTHPNVRPMRVVYHIRRLLIARKVY